MDDGVAPLPRDYSHRSKTDLIDLRNQVGHLSLEQKALVCVSCLRTGIMGGNWSLRMGMKLAKVRHGENEGLILYAKVMARRAPEVIEQLWDQTLRHMVDGKDSFDRMSAGGWNKQELDTFLKILEIVGWQRPLRKEPEEQVASAPGLG